MVFLMYALLGAFAGTLAGLFGIGGGLIIVPVLVFMLELQGVPVSVLTHIAVGTSLATIVITSLSSIRQHHKKLAVNWEIFPAMALGMVAGAVLGALTADGLSGPLLQQMIGVFALLMAAQMAFGRPPRPSRVLPGRPGLLGAGTFIGWASAIFGIGGGSLTVPFLVRCNVVMQQAVGTSAALGLPIAISGTIAHAMTGWNRAGLPEWSLGYVYLPAFVGIVSSSVFFARLGAKLAHRLDPLVLKRTFAGLLMLVGLRFLLTNL